MRSNQLEKVSQVANNRYYIFQKGFEPLSKPQRGDMSIEYRIYAIALQRSAMSINK